MHIKIIKGDLLSYRNCDMLVRESDVSGPASQY